MNQVNELTRIRRRVLTEVARLYWHGQLAEQIDSLPEKLVKQQNGSYHCCEFKEKAIYEQRLLPAMGLSISDYQQPLSEVVQNILGNTSVRSSQVEIIEYACDRCPINTFFVTNACRNCIVHSCQNACPRDAISIIQDQAYIDFNRCKECGLCRKACSYNAIIQIKRPCEQACAVKAINAGEDRKAVINYEKCVDCGACIVSCPFGAITDRSQILKVIELLRGSKPVIALVAPSIIGQFGQKADMEPIIKGLESLGFNRVYEIAEAAVQVAHDEAEEFLALVPKEKPFMTSSCCPAFTRMLDNQFPMFTGNKSECLSPMNQAASRIREETDARLVFIGPCIAKKREAVETGLIAAVLTFEELAALFVAANINLAELEEAVDRDDAKSCHSSSVGQRFAYSGGVTENILLVLDEEAKEEFKPVKADGMNECIEVLKNLNKGDVTANYVEGMACTGGCLGGAGVLVDKRYTRKYLLERISGK